MSIFDIFHNEKKREKIRIQIEEAKTIAQKYKEEASEATKHLREVYEEAKKKKQIA